MTSKQLEIWMLVGNFWRKNYKLNKKDIKNTLVQLLVQHRYTVPFVSHLSRQVSLNMFTKKIKILIKWYKNPP